jgi:hypothetical protein
MRFRPESVSSPGPSTGWMDFDRTERIPKRIAILCGVAVVVVLLVGVGLLHTSPPKRRGTTLEEVHIVFVGSGSSALAAAGGCTNFPTEIPFGASETIGLNLSAPNQPGCGDLHSESAPSDQPCLLWLSHTVHPA